MINLIIILVFIGIGFLIPKDKYNDISPFSVLVWLIGGALLILHVISWSFVSIDFDSFNARHNQLKIDLESSRNLEDSYERMAILQEITKHNQIIAENKELNKNWFIGQYIDDRVNSLETIK